MATRRQMLDALVQAQVEVQQSATLLQLRPLYAQLISGPNEDAQRNDSGVMSDASTGTSVSSAIDTTVAPSVATVINATSAANAVDNTAATSVTATGSSVNDRLQDFSDISAATHAVEVMKTGVIGPDLEEQGLDREMTKLQKQRELLLLRREVEMLQSGQRNETVIDANTLDGMVGKFSGDDSYDVQKWVDDLEEAFALMQCGCLSGTERMFVLTVNVSSFQELKCALVEEFGHRHSILDVYELLRGRKLKPDEGIQRYILEMQLIAAKAAVQEQELIDAIIAGLNDHSSLDMTLYQASTVRELKIALERYEKLRRKIKTAASVHLVRGRGTFHTQLLLL